MKKTTYMEDVAIDPEELIEELLEWPSKTEAYGEALADANDIVNDLDEKLKVLRSKIIIELFEEEGKTPAKDIREAYYRTDEEHQRYKKAWIKAVHQRDMLEVAFKNFSYTRKAALDILARLHELKWFAGPDIPLELRPGKRTTERMSVKESAQLQQKGRERLREKRKSKNERRSKTKMKRRNK
jgi:hypothetical protein